MSYNQYLSSMNGLFERLQQLGNISNSREIVEFFIREFKFLGIFLYLQSFIDIQPNMLDISQKVHTLVQDASVHSSELHLAEYFDFCTFNVQYKIWLIKMEIRAKYSFPKISSLPLISANKDGIAIPKFVTDFMDTVVEILRDLVNDPCSSLFYVPETKKHIDDVLKEMKLLRTFVCFVSERFIEHESQHLANFFSHVLAVTGHASMLVWLYFSSYGYENQDVSVVGEINVFLFLQIKFKPIQPSIRKIYIALLEALKSTIQSGGGWRANIQNHESAADSEANFLETIQHDLAELPNNSNISQSDALKDQLVILKERLDCLRANIIHVPIQHLKVLLRDIDTFIIDAGLVVYSLYKGEEEEKEVVALGEVSPALFLDLLGNIQQIIITVKLVPIRKLFHSNYLPRIHGLGYVDFILKNLKEFQSRHLDSLASTTKLLQRFQKELESWQPLLEFVAEEQHNDIDKIQRCATQLIGKAYEIEYLIDACICKNAPVWCLEHWFLDIVEDTILVKDEVTEIHEKKMVEDAMNTVIAHTASNLERSPRMNEEIVGFHDVIENLRDQLVKGTKGRDVISIVGMPGLGKTTLAYRLYSDRALFFKRYLILVDDVWEASVWDDLIGCFQDANNGSRIIITTRNREIAEYARFQSNPFSLRMFNNEESWKLLRKKVFGEESCPPLLMNIGRQIAEKCGQLPLSVALVAGVLAEVEKKEECWAQVANNLVPHIHNDSRAIIENSYKILPYHLRSCFLYFGAFLEDNVINVSKLIELWISEGFIKSCEGKSLEDIAESYLGNLIGRNLVMGTKRSSGGKIKACRIHDLLHDFCKVRAKEENLVQWMKREQNANPSSNVSCLEQLAHRMSIYGKWYRIEEWSTCWSHVGSIIVHNNCLAFDTVSHIFYSFKFLKVLDLQFTTIDSYPTDLVYLRYFAARTHNSLDTNIITYCWNLETLILQNYGVMSLPLTIWNMVNLRHLHISRCSFNIIDEKYSLDSSKSLYDLRSFTAPYFSCVEDAELILRKTPNLRELRCTFLDEDVDKFQYYVLNFPAKIETLKICCPFMFHTITIPICISAPNLRNLTLERYCLHPQHLSNIALLQNLQVLKMKSIKFDKKVWKVSSGDFPELKVLKLQEIVGFEEWDVADDEAFPKLERLVLRECEYLKEIPSAFGEISSLKYIEVRKCYESVDKSARDIRETQVEGYQNTGFEIFIHERRKYQL
ncbi:late blight resistance protein r1-a [Nicotiana attenuata]|uniref:Late blight resistance protein r1-a n=1 Tax=Nicotiana attenuata TaxID=49451 RepID=A0A1J6KE27_NICAT|nr:late blight resistance protein r1-a [Nicotiana attenuata]